MRETLGVRRRYRVRRFFGSKVAFVLLLVLFIIFTQAAVGMYAKAREAKEKRDLARSELERLEARETSLQTEISRLSSERGIEGELRDRFFIAKEGEKVAVVNTNPIPAGKQPKEEVKPGFWKRLLSAVGLSGD
jgi:cell division protein FtsB